MSKSQEAPRRERVGAEERRIQLVDVAADIVAAGGARALTIEAVVTKTGVHRPIVYRHFANADALLDAVVDRELEALRDSTTAAVEGITGFEPRVRAAVSAWMEHFARSPALMAVALVRPPASDPQRERRRRQNQSSMRFLVKEMERCGVTALDAEVGAAALLQALVGIVSLWRAKRINRRIAIDRWVRIAVATCEAFKTA